MEDLLNSVVRFSIKETAFSLSSAVDAIPQVRREGNRRALPLILAYVQYSYIILWAHENMRSGSVVTVTRSTNDG